MALSALFIGLFSLQSTLSYPGAHAGPVGQHVLKDGTAAAHSILSVRAELKKAEIIPTVIDDFMPILTLNVTWPSNETADLGNTINPHDLQKQPSIKLDDEPTSSSVGTACKSNMTYVLAMTDPDAPSRDNPEWSEFCHWIVAGVPLYGPDSACSNEDSGTEVSGDVEVGLKEGPREVMEYYPPGPPPKTWKHRYVFLVFAPANSTSQPLHLTKPKDRQNWGTGKERHGVRQWAEENELVPVAANFIYAKNKKQ